MKTLKEINLTHKNVLMRADLDIPNDSDFFRPEQMRASIDYILAQNPQSLTLIGHRGRPGGKADPKLSLKPVRDFFAKIYPEKLQVLEEHYYLLDLLVAIYFSYFIVKIKTFSLN